MTVSISRFFNDPDVFDLIVNFSNLWIMKYCEMLISSIGSLIFILFSTSKASWYFCIPFELLNTVDHILLVLSSKVIVKDGNRFFVTFQYFFPATLAMIYF